MLKIIKIFIHILKIQILSFHLIYNFVECCKFEIVDVLSHLAWNCPYVHTTNLIIFSITVYMEYDEFQHNSVTYVHVVHVMK